MPPCRCAAATPRASATGGATNPKNFLLTGGARALEGERAKAQVGAASGGVWVASPVLPAELLTHVNSSDFSRSDTACQQQPLPIQPRPQPTNPRPQAAAARAAARDLRGVNATLAAELARSRAAGEHEGEMLRGELSSLAGRFRAEQVGRDGGEAARRGAAGAAGRRLAHGMTG